MPKTKPQTLRLPAELTIYTASQSHAAMLDWLDDEPADRPTDARCPMDGAAVEQIDAAGVQLLLSLAKALGNRQRLLRLVDASGPLQAACESLGVADLLAEQRNDDPSADADRT